MDGYIDDSFEKSKLHVVSKTTEKAMIQAGFRNMNIHKVECRYT